MQSEKAFSWSCFSKHGTYSFPAVVKLHLTCMCRQNERRSASAWHGWHDKLKCCLCFAWVDATITEHNGHTERQQWVLKQTQRAARLRLQSFLSLQIHTGPAQSARLKVRRVYQPVVFSDALVNTSTCLDKNTRRRLMYWGMRPQKKSFWGCNWSQKGGKGQTAAISCQKPLTNHSFYLPNVPLLKDGVFLMVLEI